jgi:hypothetical protein
MHATQTSPGRLPGLPLAERLEGEGGSTNFDARKPHRCCAASDHRGAVQTRDAQEGKESGAAETAAEEVPEELLTPGGLWAALIRRTDGASVSSLARA